MDQLEALVTALMAGAAAGSSTMAAHAVTDSYAALKGKLAALLARHGKQVGVLDAVEAGDEDAEARLRAELADINADLYADADLSAAVGTLQAALKHSSAGKFTVMMTGTSTGVVIGDNHHLTMHIGQPSRAADDQ